MFIDLKIENVAQSISKWDSDDIASYKARKDKVNRPGFPRHSPGSLRNAFQTLPVTADC